MVEVVGVVSNKGAIMASAYNMLREDQGIPFGKYVISPMQTGIFSRRYTLQNYIIIHSRVTSCNKIKKICFLANVGSAAYLKGEHRFGRNSSGSHI